MPMPVPVTPRWYWMPTSGNHGSCSLNCSPEANSLNWL